MSNIADPNFSSEPVLPGPQGQHFLPRRKCVNGESNPLKPIRTTYQSNLHQLIRGFDGCPRIRSVSA